eukprot:CAMPEP_0194523322 /NCGR_PEP_ID=MMETSP0253-20130528/58178_1 /TAXON_ID=2966 /ORGANISM="Noctiluca scintillans" /LENGTH=303 /DNA_ID=CAMNT_0039367847 /DNA_START=287 /DNA_END=1198 /DNA_ORIENTATION=+
MVMPFEEDLDIGDSLAYFLQLHVRTLDGIRFCEEANPWCVVFWMKSKSELDQSARLLIEYMDLKKQDRSRKSGSLTSIPFSCLDCLEEFEAAAASMFRRRLTSGSAGDSELEQDTKKRIPCQVSGLGIALRHGEVQPLLTISLAESLFEYLPVDIRLPGVIEWVLKYTPKADGVSFATMYRNVGLRAKTLVVVEDSEGYIFGGFAPETWEPRGKFYGSGESFVFSFINKQFHFYPATLRNNFFMYSDNESLGMGGGSGLALLIFSDLLRGVSASTATFGNPVLASSAEFVIKDFEIWAFEDCP